jgi:hypothetical protein
MTTLYKDGDLYLRTEHNYIIMISQFNPIRNQYDKKRSIKFIKLLHWATPTMKNNNPICMPWSIEAIQIELAFYTDIFREGKL